MYRDKRVSVVMPAYNEGEAIEKTVRDFLRNEHVDEVVVADNNSRDDTRGKAKRAGAKVVREGRQGYGFACRRALAEAAGHYIILTESDSTFSSSDVIKFLAYSDDFDLVLGTRTSKELIWEGANMGIFLRWGNWFLAKMIEVLFNGPSLTDVGCTYRLIKKPALERIRHKFTVGGPSFSPEMMILAIKGGISTVEIPVNYRPRRGVSKITGRKWPAFKLGLKMIRLICSYKMEA